jgi:lysozyme family protein
MVASSFDGVLKLVLTYEGGFVNHPHDPGGATFRGITQATLSAYRGRSVSVAQLKALTLSEIAAIYRRNYWDVIKGDALPAGLDLMLFDMAVNSGPKRAAMMMQRLLGVEPDGVIGPITLEALQDKSIKTLITTFGKKRLTYLKRLRTWPVFGRGWQSRVEHVTRQALVLYDKSDFTAAQG